MNTQNNVIYCYNKTANSYADKYYNELNYKHLDQLLLKAFAENNKAKGRLIDFGCGPGQTTKYLYDNDFLDIIGTDISEEMIAVASKLNSNISFEVADLLHLKYNDNTFGSAIAFYSFVHFTYEQFKIALLEVKRVLTINGEFLLSFHVGDEVVTYNNFLDMDVSIKFYAFELKNIITIIYNLGFEVIDCIVRQPYAQEYPSERAYIWLKKVNM